MGNLIRKLNLSFKGSHAVGAIASAALLTSGAAWAGQSSVNTRATLQIPGNQSPAVLNNDTLAERTNQISVYRKANETLGLQALYIYNKVKALEDEKAKNSSNAKAWARILKEEIGPFCLPSEKTDDCFDRYVLLQAQTLQAIRGEFARNQMTIALLQGGKSALAKGKAFALESSKYVYQTRVPYRTAPKTYSELTQDYQAEFAQLRELTSVEFERWLKDIPREPSREDFVKFVRAKKTSMVQSDDFELDRSCGAEVCYDDAAYQVALDAFRIDKDKAGQTFEMKLEAAITKTERGEKGALPQVPSVLPNTQATGARSLSSYDSAIQAIDAKVKAVSQTAGKNQDVNVLVDPESFRIP